MALRLPGGAIRPAWMPPSWRSAGWLLRHAGWLLSTPAAGQHTCLPVTRSSFSQGALSCRTKALLALSCLVRHHGASLDAFRAAGGLRLLAAALGDGAGRAKRKALQLLREVLPKTFHSHGVSRLALSRCPLLVHHQPGRHGAVLLSTPLA